MTHIERSFGRTQNFVAAVGNDVNQDTVAPVITDADAGGVRVVTATYPSFTCVLNNKFHTVAGGHVHLNAADVASPTTHYVYVNDVGGVPTVQASTTNPITNGAITDYFLLNIVRFECAVGSPATYYVMKYPGQGGVDELAHNLREDSMFYEPKWVSGIAPSISAAGKISTTSGYVRFPGNEPRSQAAITEGAIILDDESSIETGIAGILTYADGSAVTDQKFVKVLLGVLRDKENKLSGKYILMRQSKPSVEYASAAAALGDAERRAATGFPAAYLASVTPICYITAKVDTGILDHTKGTTVDLRATGLTGGSAGGGAITSHSALADLNVVADHPGYLTVDGARPLTGNWDAGAKDITTTGDMGCADFTASGAITGDTVSASTLESTVAIGTAPMTVTSTDKVTNLNADLLDGEEAAAFVKHDGTVTMTGALNMGSKAITAAAGVATTTLTASGLAKALTFESTQTTGTAPFAVASTTKVTSLNADQLDGLHDTAFLKADGSVTATGNFSVNAGVTFDGVDVGDHAANANAHHNAVTLGATATGLLDLSTQEIGLDNQTANYVFAGPTSGAATTPAFRALDVADIPRQPSAALALANSGNDNVAVSERKSVQYITGPTSNFAVTGFLMGGANVDGMVLRLHNASSKTMTLSNDSTSTAANRIYSGGATIASGRGCTLVYDGTVSRWVLAS